jgi:GxxExxY protein
VKDAESVLDSLTYQVIGLAMQTHSELGPGVEEICYHEVLSSGMEAASIPHAFKPRRQLLHRGSIADQFEADIVIPDRLVLEAKRLRGDLAAVHFAQLHCYMKVWQIDTGLLFDFGKQSLMVRRRKGLPHFITPSAAELQQFLRQKGLDAPVAEVVGFCLDRILVQHGLGYWETTYRGLVEADLRAEGIGFLANPEIRLMARAGRQRGVKLDCFVIEERLVLIVFALQDSVTAAAQAILGSYLRHLGLRTGVVVNFGKRRLDVFVRCI